METLVLLTALVCGAIAAPALQEQGFQEFKPTQDVLEELTQREKKSPANNNGFMEFSNPETSPSHTFDSDSFPETARSLHIRKPLIVKKKVGYHLYRDSDEEKEQATSRETCKEKVKVKLCDENVLPKSSDLMRTTTIEDVGDHAMSENEMQHSLRMAKEAIANLERDMKKIEHNPGTKLSHRKNEDVDAQVHEDIDTARRVLEHIHKNFGDLDSMRIHTTTSKDADSLHDVHLTITKTEEEKMAQWKEAMKNIQRNTEIARNIEDSFKSVGQNQPLNHFLSPSNDENVNSHNHFHEMRTENIESLDKSLDKPKQCGSKLHEAKLARSQVENTEHLEDDMNGFASSIIETTDGKLLRNNDEEIKAGEIPSSQTLIGPSNKNNNPLLQSKNSDNVANGEVQFSDDHTVGHGQVHSMRKVDNQPINELNTDAIDTITTNGDASEASPITSSTTMKATESDTIRNAGCLDNVHKKHNHDHVNADEHGDTNKLNKSAANDDSSDSVNIRINDKLENNLQKQQSKSVDTTETITSNQLLHQTRNNKNDAIPNETQHTALAIIKPFDDSVSDHFQGKMGSNEPITSTSQLTNPDHETFSTNLKPIHTEKNAGMKAVASDNIPTLPINHAFNTRSDQMKNNKHTVLDKGSDSVPSNFRNRVPSMNTHFLNGPHMMHSMDSASDFDSSSSHTHLHTSQVNRMHGHMAHGKSPDMDNTAQSNFNMNMRDAMGNIGPDNNMMRWKPAHDSARTAYGPMTSVATGAGPSAVGVFPNANVGGCSIPLLLSCSPSVTSGSLAKALPSGYGSPAYRTEDELTFFHNKREVKKTNENLDTTVMKIPSNTIQKIAVDTKQ